MGYITKTSDYWIAPNAITITLNALGEANRIQGSAASGAVIMCFIENIKPASQGGDAQNGDGLLYTNGHEYKTWPISISPTYFNSNTRKYVYCAIPRSTTVGSQAVIVFPSEQLDIYGKAERTTTDPQTGETTTTEVQVGSTDYFYIYLQGIISAVFTNEAGVLCREWEDPIKGDEWGSLDTAGGRDAKINTSDWYHYDLVTQVVTFLKPIIMSATSWFRNLIIGSGETKGTLDGVATKDTSEEYVDSETLVVTPSYINGKFLSKTHDDTAQGNITFAKNIFVKGLLTAYNAVMNNIHSSNFTGHGLADTGWSITSDYNGHSKLTIDELYVRMKAVFESLEVRERTYTGGDQIFSCAGNYVNRTDYLSEEEGEEVEVDDKGAPKNALGYSDIKVPFMLRSLWSALVGRKPLATKRRVRFHFAPQSTGADEVIRSIRRVRCYFLAKDDDREIHNWWQLNDLARCQTMNLANVNRETYLGEDHKIGNVFWWRKVIAVSSTPCTLSDGKQYHWFDVAYNHDIEQSDDPAERAAAATFAMLGSDIPAAGDSVVQFGNTTQEGRMNLIMIEVNGGTSDDGYSAATEAPSIKAYRGIYCFDLTKCWVGGSPRKMMLSPKSGYEFYGPSFKQVTEYDVVPVPVERGLWTGIDFERDDYDRDEKPDYSDDATSTRGNKRNVRKCYYFDKVSHNGRYWLCSIVDGAHWRAEVAFGTYAAGDVVLDGDYNAMSVEDKQKCERRQNYTVDEPSEDSINWQMVVDRGQDGEAGESAFTIDIDNEHDAFAADNSGKVLVQQARTTHIHLLFGSQRQLLTANPTVTLIDATTGAVIKQSSSTIRVTTATGNGTNEGTVGITVYQNYTIPSGIYADITAQCAKGPLTARFSLGVEKSGEDGVSPTVWNLAPTLSEFSFARASDGVTLTPDSLQANIYVSETTGNETTLHTSASTIKGKSFKIRCGWQDGAAQGAVNVGGTVMLSRTTAASNTYVWVELWNAADLDGTTPVSGKTWIDRETIPINKDGAKGQDGTGSNATRADIDNESDVLPCDSEGKVVSQFTISTVARIYDGADPVAADSYSDVADLAIDGITSAVSTRGISDNGVQFSWTFPANHQFSADKFAVLIRMTRNSRNYYVSFSASVVKSGEPGVSPTLYQLLPSMSSIPFSKNSEGTGYTPSSRTVKCGYTETTGDDTTPHPDSVSTGDYNIYYRKTTSGNYTMLTTSGVTASTTDSFVEFILCQNTAATVAEADISGLIDRETVPVVKDGLNGADGASAWVADLDNDMSSVALDSSNHPSATQEVTANILLFYGVVAKTPVITSIVRHYGSGSTRTWTTGSNTNAYAGVKVNWDGAAITITYGTSATISDRDDFTVNFRDSVDASVTRSLTLTVAGIRGDARFELVPSASSIVKSESSTFTPSVLSCNLTKYDVRKGQYVTPAASEYDMSYIADGGKDIIAYTANTSLTPGTNFTKSIEFRLSVGGVIVDRETINIVEDGSDGENIVQVTLDNQHEDFLYSDTGLISPSGGATSPIHLYDGKTDKTTQAMFRVFDDYTQTWVTSTGSSASAAASVTVNNGVVTLSVTALRSDSAKVRVRAEYPASSGKYFYAEFTANKVKQDKYDLIVKPSSITYNSASYSAVTINASAKRTDLQGNQTTPSISTTANSGNLRLFKGFVNSAGTIQSLTRQTAASYRVTAQNCEDYIGIYFELRWYYDSSTSDSSDQTTYRLCDYETVEIAKAENGTNGNDAHEVNPNILLRTIFDQGIDSVKEKWSPRLSWGNIFVDTANDTIVLGRKSIRIVAPLDDYEDLTERVYELNVYHGVKTNTWYTLSFYSFSGKQQASTSTEEYFLHTYVYPESDSACIDISQVYVDGVQKTLRTADGDVEWANAWTGARHTFTFKTLSSFPTNYVDVKFRVKAGGIGCICMPKLEEGMVATAYLPNEDDTIGADGANGEAGTNVIATPSAIIVNQDVTNTNNLNNLSSDTAARCVFSIMKGTQQLTVTAVSVSSKSHCEAQGGSRNYVQLTSIKSSSGKYYDSGYVICSLTYNDGGTNRTITNVRVNFYANLLGTWAVETTAAATTAAGEKIETELGPNGAITTAYTAAIQANAKELRSEYTEQISRAGDYNRNLFGYNRGITLGRSSGELPIPFIQGYGLILRGLQDGVTGGRLYNLKLDGVGGPFVITCQMRLSASASGKKVLMELCGKVNTRGEGSVPADSDYVDISSTWTNYEFHLDITDEQAVHADLDGYLDIQGNWSGGPYIYIRHLKIERGMKATDWCEADEDIAYLGHGQMITALTANSKDNQGTTISGTSITQTTFTINDSEKAGYSIAVNLSNLASGRYITFLEQRDAFTLTAGKIYTLSYWAKGTAGIVLKNYLYKGGATIITGIGYNVYDPGGNGTIVEGVTGDGDTSVRLNNSNWLYYCIHFYVANSVTGATIIPLRVVKADNSTYSGSAYIYIADIRLQEGYVVSETYFRSMIEQNARRISLIQQTGSRLAGIDIENGIITLKGDRVTFSNGDGNIKDKVVIDPETGTLYAVDGKFSGQITVKGLTSQPVYITQQSGTYVFPEETTGAYFSFIVNNNMNADISNLGDIDGREITFVNIGEGTLRLTGTTLFTGVAANGQPMYSGNGIVLYKKIPVKLIRVQNVGWCVMSGAFDVYNS